MNTRPMQSASLRRVQVMIVDDSAVVRQALTEVLNADPGIEVLCAVADPLLAMERMESRWPQVVVAIDVEMLRMDGLIFLRKIMSERPTPVAGLLDAHREAGAATTLEALAAGAVSIVTMPKLGLRRFIEDASADLASAVKAASHANVNRLRVAHRTEAHRQRTARRGASRNSRPTAILSPSGPKALQQTTERIIAIGTSTGCTQALE